MTTPAGGERVLVVDDEPDIVALVAYHLAKAGYRVSTAATGTDALRAAREERPALVVLDLMLPGMSGFDVLEQLRAHDATREVAVLMLTARKEEPDRVRGLTLGADDYLTKPFSPAELELRVAAILRRVGELTATEYKLLFKTGPGTFKAGLENNAYGMFLGNADPRLSFGFDYAERMTQTIKPTDSTVVGNTAKLYDGFVTVRPSLFKDPKGTPWGLILRYDKYQANTTVDANRTLFIGTIFLDVAKNSSLGLSYQDDVAHDATKTSDQLRALEKSMWQLNWQVTF